MAAQHLSCVPALVTQCMLPASLPTPAEVVFAYVHGQDKLTSLYTAFKPTSIQKLVQHLSVQGALFNNAKNYYDYTV